MDNKAMALTVNTFDDLLNMNADIHDSIRRLTVKYADCKSSIRHVVLFAIHGHAACDFMEIIMDMISFTLI